MTDEIERVRELYEEASREVYRRGLCGTSYDTQMIALLTKRLQPKPGDHGISEMEAGFMQLRQDNNDLRKRLDDLTQRLNQPKPTPAPKVWSVSDKTLAAFRAADHGGRLVAGLIGLEPANPLNAIVDNILRDRPDAVAKEWERRYLAAHPLVAEGLLAKFRRDLFPEVEG